jgi:hypothetical protein
MVLRFAIRVTPRCSDGDTDVLAVTPGVPDYWRMHLGAAVWIGLGAAALIFGGALLLRRKPSDGFGAVSDQWVMQHRATPPDDRS